MCLCFALLAYGLFNKESIAGDVRRDFWAEIGFWRRGRDTVRH